MTESVFFNITKGYSSYPIWVRADAIVYADECHQVIRVAGINTNNSQTLEVSTKAMKEIIEYISSREYKSPEQCQNL